MAWWMRYESQGVVATTAIYSSVSVRLEKGEKRPYGPYGDPTHHDQKQDLVDVNGSGEGAIEEREDYRRRYRILQVSLEGRRQHWA